MGFCLDPEKKDPVLMIQQNYGRNRDDSLFPMPRVVKHFKPEFQILFKYLIKIQRNGIEI